MALIYLDNSKKKLCHKIYEKFSYKKLFIVAY